MIGEARPNLIPQTSQTIRTRQTRPTRLSSTASPTILKCHKVLFSQPCGIFSSVPFFVNKVLILWPREWRENQLA